MTRRQSPSLVRARRAFTLVEILIVVIILGILAAIVIPTFANTTRDASNGTFGTNIRTFNDLVNVYYAKHNRFPVEQPVGVTPAEMEDVLGTYWTHPTPLGGQWDWDCEQFGITAGISVIHPNRTDAEMTLIDKIIDDGDLDTGNFHRRTDGFIFVIEP